MKPEIKVKVIWFIFFVAIYLIVFSIFIFFKIEPKLHAAGIIGVIAALVMTIIAPRTKKIKLQSGEKIIVTNDLFNLFKKEDS